MKARAKKLATLMLAGTLVLSGFTQPTVVNAEEASEVQTEESTDNAAQEEGTETEGITEESAEEATTTDVTTEDVIGGESTGVTGGDVEAAQDSTVPEEVVAADVMRAPRVISESAGEELVQSQSVLDSGQITTAEELKTALEKGGRSYELANDIEVGKMSISVTTKVTLDLKGHTIKKTYGASNHYIIDVKTGGEFTMNDTVGTGKIDATVSYGYGISIGSDCTFYLNGGTIEATETVLDNKGSNASIWISGGLLTSPKRYAPVLINGTGTVVQMTDGVIQGGSNAAIMFSPSSENIDNPSTFIMTGGTIEGGNGNAIFATKTSSIKIDDGEIKAPNGSAVYTDANNSGKAPKIELNGGTYTAKYEVIDLEDGTNCKINGGSYSSTNDSVIKLYTKNDTIQITGGEFTAAKRKDLFDFGSGAEKSQVELVGGTFNVDPSEYVTDPSQGIVSGDTTGGKKFATGTSENLNEAVEQMITEGAKGIEVTKGNVSLDINTDQVTVSNKGGGAVTVNGQKVPEGGTVTTHIHNATHTDAKAASCTEDGNIEYWYCEGCKKFFNDAELKNEIEESTIVIKAEGHKYGEDGKCTVCGAIEGQAVVTTGEEFVQAVKDESIDHIIVKNSIEVTEILNNISRDLVIEGAEAGTKVTFNASKMIFTYKDGVNVEIKNLILEGNDIAGMLQWNSAKDYQEISEPKEMPTFRVENCTFTNSEKKGAGIGFWNDNRNTAQPSASEVTVTGCTFDNIGVGLYFSEEGPLPNLKAEISKCTFTNYNWGFLGGPSNAYIHDNTFDATGEYALQFLFNASATKTGTRIENNVIDAKNGIQFMPYHLNENNALKDGAGDTVTVTKDMVPTIKENVRNTDEYLVTFVAYRDGTSEYADLAPDVLDVSENYTAGKQTQIKLAPQKVADNKEVIDKVTEENGLMPEINNEVYYQDSALTNKVNVEDVKAAAEVDKLIEAIGPTDKVTADSLDAIVKAEEAYKALTEAQKALVTKKDVLDAARAAYDALHFHKAEAVAAKEPSCTEDGNTAYWYCEGCDTYFSDAECTIEIAKEDTVIKAVGHQYDDRGKCTVCGVLTPDAEAANKVDALIDAIGSPDKVMLESRDAINAAVNAYNALTDTQKKLVTGYEDLDKAVKAYKALLEAEEGKDPDKDRPIEKPDNGTDGADKKPGAVQTGDTTNVAGYMTVMVLAAGIAVFAVIRRKRRG